MPLLDHFRPPLSMHHPWRSIHSAWANAIVQQLNEDILPERYYALPNVESGGGFEIDVAALEHQSHGAAPSGAVETAVWAPPEPTLTVPVAGAALDIFEVQVVDEEVGKVVAAVELVSPSNKDRPASRRAFAVTCAALLQQGVAVTVVDAVTRRSADMHVELLQILEAGEAVPLVDELRAVSYRLLPGAGTTASSLEAWSGKLAVGSPLPNLPLWLDRESSVPLDLEQSYAAACRALRIHE